jgi:hypothetical protein
MRIDRISSVSGGSIAAGLLAKSWASLRFENGVAGNLRETFISSVLDMTSRLIDVRVGIAGFLPFVSAGNRLAALYDDKAFQDMRLGDLPDHCRTGRPSSSTRRTCRRAGSSDSPSNTSPTGGRSSPTIRTCA